MVSDWLARLEEHILDLPTGLVLGLAFLMPALESSVMLGFIFPGEIAVVIAGIVAHNNHIPIEWVILVAVAGAVIGDQVGYYVGKRWGEALLNKVPDKLLGPRRIAAGQAYVRRLGARAVIVGRWTAALRALVPGIAGMSEMEYKRFTLANIFGGAVWAVICALVGYGAGGSLDTAKDRLGPVPFIAGGLIILFILIAVARSRRKSEHRMMEELADEGLAENAESQLQSGSPEAIADGTAG